ncbi:MAG TPA: hypothetical protein PKA66_13700, partial [Gemmatimonadales bacterium]|nr:hypothetical protein [Gemmatimonadales bacterium]
MEALRATYQEVSDSADFVMYWWVRAAQEVAAGQTSRAGLITTNTITQTKNREMVAAAALKGAKVIWAVADHPWTDAADGAAVRVAMTVTSAAMGPARLLEVGDDASPIRERMAPRLNDDLTIHADVASVAREQLSANHGLSSQGYKRSGEGFLLSRTEAEAILGAEPRYGDVVKPFLAGKDLSERPRNLHVVDFALMDEDQARSYSLAYERVRDRVKPERAANKREAYVRLWWRFAEPRRELRGALKGLHRFIATLEVSKFRFFVFLEGAAAPDGTLVCIASEEAATLGVLSSRIHLTWVLAASGSLEDRPRYTKSLCLDPFPFPDVRSELLPGMSDLAERLDQHRKDAIARDERVTMTGMYNVVEKLRSGGKLTPKERAIHEIAACGVL